MPLDFSQLLYPISTEQPAGEDLQEELLFSTLRSARESDPDYLLQGDWEVSEPRQADWKQVQTLSAQALVGQTKDLQLACWLVESSFHLHGLEGLNAGIGFLSAFISHFWSECWPSLEEEGIDVRRSILMRLDRDISRTLTEKPLLSEASTSLSCWRQILALEHKTNPLDEERGSDIRQYNPMTMASFNQLAVSFSSKAIHEQAERVAKILDILESLNVHYLSLSNDLEGSLFSVTRQVMIEIADYLQCLAIRTAPDINIPSDSNDGTLTHRSMPEMQAQMTREQAISQMLTIAAWFRKVEPSSPVPFLLERAARWTTMTLPEWLEEMLNDESNIQEINKILIGRSL
jgi:type VI secretion system protein ImpA